MKRPLLLFAALFLCGEFISAQTRYIDKIFAETDSTQNILYGENISILTGSPTKVPLKLDLYEPSGDTVSRRPVVLMFGTGNFLPPVINGSPFGSFRDSAMVTICREFALRGYVSIAVEYRLGWNPVSTDDNVRRSTILQAAYRGIQDCRTAIRFLKMTVAEMNNPYRVDTSRITVGGIGTGGYISTGAAFLSDYTEISSLTKFIDLDQNPPVPYVIESVHGDIEGKDSTIVGQDSNGNPIFLNLGNHVSYSSGFSTAFHMGGALGSDTWIGAEEPPVISIHSPDDELAPFYIGDVIVNTTGEIVIGDAAGGGRIQELQDSLESNQVWKVEQYNDPVTQQAKALGSPYFEALYAFKTLPAPADTQCYAFPGTPVSEGLVDAGPWNWYNEAAFIAAWDFINPQPPISGEMQNCDVLRGSNNDPVRAKLFIDTVMQFITPRLTKQLFFTDAEDELLSSSLSVYPNPAQDLIRVESKEGPLHLKAVWLRDITGRIITEKQGVNTGMTLDVRHLPRGVYLLEVQTNTARSVQKILIE